MARQAKDRFCCDHIRRINTNSIPLVRFGRRRTTTHYCTIGEGYVYFVFSSSAFVSSLSVLRSRDGVCGIVTTIRAGRSGVRVPAGARGFSFLNPYPANMENMVSS